MIRTIRFYKEATNRWYADLHEWEGSQAELEMVCGADDMLNIVSEGEDETKLTLSLEPFDNCNTLELLREDADIGGGWYIMKTYSGIEFNKELWLCDVTKFLYGEMPKNIGNYIFVGTRF